MFNNLVQSSSHSDEMTRRGSFFAGALGVYTILFAAFGVVGVFAYDANLDRQNLELVALLTPPPMVETQVKPIVPRPLADVKDSAVVGKTTRTSEPPSPDPTRTNTGVAVTTRQAPPLPQGVTDWEIGPKNENITGNLSRTDGSLTGPGRSMSELATGSEPPPAPKKVEKPAETRSITISKGPVNGLAVSLPKPPYPQMALISHVSGQVSVQVLIDESGKVVSAKAVSGNPLLQRAAVQAAYLARFTPTRLGEVAVKVSGVINYNFQLP
jgi:TonB family protein